MAKSLTPNLKNIPETLFLTLYARARESQRPDALIRDENAMTMVKRLNYDFEHIRMSAYDELFIILRARQFDRHAIEFLAKNPDGIIFHIGCGLDTRFGRVDNGQVEWYDMDLPEVIEIRKTLIDGKSDRYHLWSGSILEHGWIEELQNHGGQPILFMAEGVFPYFEEKQVKNIFQTISTHYPGAEIVCDAHNAHTVQIDSTMLMLARIDARLRWRLDDPKSIESWSPGNNLLDQWLFLDDPEPRLKHHLWIRMVPGLEKSSGVYHYRLGEISRQTS